MAGKVIFGLDFCTIFTNFNFDVTEIQTTEISATIFHGESLQPINLSTLPTSIWCFSLTKSICYAPLAPKNIKLSILSTSQICNHFAAHGIIFLSKASNKGEFLNLCTFKTVFFFTAVIL